MKHTKLSEQPFVLAANCIILLGQMFAIKFVKSDLTMFGFIWIILFIIITPLLCFSYNEVRKNNYLYKHGKIVKAKLCKENTKIIFAASTTMILKVQCTYFDNGIVYIFEDEYSFSVYDKSKIMNCIEKADYIDVMTDKNCKKYRILFESLFPEMYNKINIVCPSIANYIVACINVVACVIYVLMSW